MLQIALSQVKLNYRRFIAIGLAVILAVAFLVASLILGSSTQATLKASVGQSFAKADAVLEPPEQQAFSQAAVDAVAASEALAGQERTQAMYPQLSAIVLAETDSRTFGARLLNLPTNPRLLSQPLLEGTLPERPGQVAVERSIAQQASLALGSSLVVSVPSGGGPASVPEAGAPTGQQLEIVGIVQDSADPRTAGIPGLLASTATVAALSARPLAYSSIQLALNGPLDPGTRSTLQLALASAGFPGSTVLTADEKINTVMRGLTGGQEVLTWVLLAFVAISLIVATLVVANIFGVLVAQRTRELALLRCLGAKKSQIRGSVMVEACAIGVIASVLGVALGTGGMLALTTLARQLPGQEFTTFGMDWTTPLIGIAVGTLLTVTAALIPARAATAVAPLAALRPADDTTLGTRRGRVRLVMGGIAILLGGVMLTAGAILANLALALPGGALTFIGVILCSSLFLPRLVTWVGRLAAPAGVPGKLAMLNAVRNPGRTTTTASALLIGVTLVSMMLTGAATSRSALAGALDGRYPVDLEVAMGNYSPNAVSSVASLDGVQAVAQLPQVGTANVDGAQEPVLGISADDARAVLSTEQNRPKPGQVLVGNNRKLSNVTVTSDTGRQTLPVTLATSRAVPLLVSLETLPVSDSSAKRALWLKVDQSASPSDVQKLRDHVAKALGVEDFQVGGGAMEKASFNQVIDILLLVVTGLLAIAVFIALIGVANTLSLSVLERTRENALLRALGLSRRALRGMLALEALLIAGVGALVGAVLGILYGWLGAQSALGSFTTVPPQVPWLQLLAVVAVAGIAGLAASVIPARRAARLSPVAGLAIE